MTLQWSACALGDREAIFDYLEAENPYAAVAVDERIRAHVEILRQFPESGRLGRVKGTRELVIVGTPYVVAYTVPEGGRVRILRVLHAAQQWPDAIQQ